MEKRLCSLQDQATAGMIEDILRQEGFHMRPLNTSGNASFAGAGQWYDLWVPEEEEAKARNAVISAGFQTALVGK